MKTTLYRYTLALLVTAAATTSRAQSVEEIRQQFPGKTAVFSNVNRQVEISFEKGVPYARATEISEMLILDDKANGVFNKDRVYHSHFNELKKVEAYTTLPDNNNKKLYVKEFKTEASPSSGVFYDDVKETSFDYPKMFKGSVAHVETEHINKDIHFLSPFYFSSYLPVINASFSVVYPEDVEVKYIIKNDEARKITVTETKKGRKRKLEFTATGISNNEYFPSAVSTSYFASHVIVYVTQYKNGDDEVVPVFGSVNDLYKWNAGFLKGINTQVDPLVKSTADSICAGLTSSRQKAEAIYTWVQNHIKYVAFENGLEGFVPQQASEVCAKRYGDCKAMASLLTAMLNASGIDAYFTWLGTRTIPYTYNEVPLPLTDNHMISVVRIDGEWIFLDATDPNCIFGLPTRGIQDKQALVSINEHKYELVKVPVVPASANIITDSAFLTYTNKVLKGSCSVTYSGYFGNDFYNNLLYNKGDDERVYVRRRMAKGSNKFIMQDYSLHYTDRARRQVNVRSNFEIPEYVKSIDDEIYLNLNLEKLFNTNILDSNKRKVAVENDFLHTIHQVHDLKIPDGYKLDYLPADFSIANELVEFSIRYKEQNGHVSATQHYVLKTLYIQPAEFPKWNDVIRKVSAAYKEEVVFKKK